MQFPPNHQIVHTRNDFENWPEPKRHRVVSGERGAIMVPRTTLEVPLERK